MKINKATQKSIKRGVAAVAIGVVLVLADRPQYAPIAGFVPFLIRWGQPSEKDITFAKGIVEEAIEDDKP